MRTFIVTTLLAITAALPAAAKTPLFVTTVSAGLPDPNGKVPTFDGVPGSGVLNFDVSAPLGVLSAGKIYTVCVSIENVSATGTGTFAYAITRGSLTVASATIGTIQNLTKAGIYALCLNTPALPASPGNANLTGSVTVTVNGQPVTEKLTTKISIK